MDVPVDATSEPGGPEEPRGTGAWQSVPSIPRYPRKIETVHLIDDPCLRGRRHPGSCMHTREHYDRYLASQANMAKIRAQLNSLDESER